MATIDCAFVKNYNASNVAVGTVDRSKFELWIGQLLAIGGLATILRQKVIL